MATSKLDIISAALVLIGDKPLNDLTEPRIAATAANNLYDSTYEAMLCQHRWRFASGKATLNRLVAAPLNQWTYAFQIPADFLMGIGVRPNTPFEIFEDQIYSNQTALDLDYIYRPAESQLPPYFVKAMEYEMATQLAIAVTDRQSYYQLYRSEASEHWKRARFADSAQRPNRAIESNPFTHVRA